MNQKKMALVVGNAEIRSRMTGYVTEFFSVISADDGAEAKQLADSRADSLSIIFIGVSSSDNERLELVDYLSDSGLIRRVPVIIFSEDSDPRLELYAYEKGIAEFLVEPFDAEVVQVKLHNLMGLYHYKDELEEQSAQHIREAIQNHRNTLDFLANVIEARNMENGEHVSRVKSMTRILAEQVMVDYPQYGLDEKKVSLIADASALHDLGKIMIRESVLLKPGRLTEEETQYMKSHTVYGCLLLNKMKNMLFEDFYRVSYEICRYHHEKVDGSGYPEGLHGDAIPLSAQIVSMADCFDALTAKRPYKPAYPAKVAYRMIMDGECGAFSPEMLASFKRCRVRMTRICEQQD